MSLFWRLCLLRTEGLYQCFDLQKSPGHHLQSSYWDLVGVPIWSEGIPGTLPNELRGRR
jgi:hypothetical protein